ncbi:MAG: hypothetical protein Q8K75_02655 [Chlamydiales bacterium]|nr:hypothetical protein [Chlamydiales bacterium]
MIELLNSLPYRIGASFLSSAVQENSTVVILQRLALLVTSMDPEALAKIIAYSPLEELVVHVAQEVKDTLPTAILSSTKSSRNTFER